MVARRSRRNPPVARRTLQVARKPVVTTVTAHPGVARRWIYTTLWLHRRQHRHSVSGLTVGLGVQWTPPFRRRKLSSPPPPAGGSSEPRPGTLQLCAGNRCLVFQIAAAAVLPRILRRFLADGRVTFAAYNVASDCRKLRAHHGVEVASTLEIRSAGDGLGNASMAEMADVLLGIPRARVEKPAWVDTSEWDGKRLSPAQVRYAAADAYLSRRLGDRIRRRKRDCNGGGGVHYVAAAREEEDEYEYESDGCYDYDDGDDERELVTLPEPDERDDGRWTYRLVGGIGSAAWRGASFPPPDGGGMELEEDREDDDDDLGGGYRQMSTAPYYQQLPYQEPIGVVY